jgi:hypothetical protein
MYFKIFRPLKEKQKLKDIFFDVVEIKSINNYLGKIRRVLNNNSALWLLQSQGISVSTIIILIVF